MESCHSSRNQPLDGDEHVVESEKLLRKLERIVTWGGVAAIAIVAFYCCVFRGGISSSSDRWGQFGDFVGGTLNPVFSFLGLIALLSTVALQVRELAVSTKELRNSAEALSKQSETLKKEQFEASFFQLLKIHTDIVNAMDLVSNRIGPKVTTRGRDCIKFWVKKIDELADGVTDVDTFSGRYSAFYRETEHEIGHYFRTLYTILKFVKNSDSADKNFYSNIVRAQLSSSELRLLFYNGLSEYGREKMKPLMEEFSILKTVLASQLPHSNIVRRYDASVFGGTYPK